MKYLICACCDCYTRGRQWWNQDTGYGLCKECADYIEAKEGKEYLEECYGKRGIHFDLTDNNPGENP